MLRLVVVLAVGVSCFACGAVAGPCRAACGANASCVDGACRCAAGFVGDGASCTQVTCPPLIVASGDVTPSTAGRVGTVATYSCRAGFRLSGQATRTCQADGTWSGTEPTCVP